MTAVLSPPPTWGFRVRLLSRTIGTLIRVEVVIRRTSIAAMCASLGIVFSGFQVPDEPATVLPKRVLQRWWAVEAGLRWWPFARRRQCLRRSLVLGHELRRFEPTLCLRVLSTDPFRAHAWLVVRGQHLDMGDITSDVPETPVP